MRERIQLMRATLVEKLPSALPAHDFRLRARRSAACSRTRASTRRRCKRLREEFSVYAIDTGRICVAALNSRNVDYVADADRGRAVAAIRASRPL